MKKVSLDIERLRGGRKTLVKRPIAYTYVALSKYACSPDEDYGGSGWEEKDRLECKVRL